VLHLDLSDEHTSHSHTHQVADARGDGARGGGGASDEAQRTKRENLSENAKKLFDLAMKSDEFRNMMQLYTGMDDRTSIIDKYAEM